MMKIKRITIPALLLACLVGVGCSERRAPEESQDLQPTGQEHHGHDHDHPHGDHHHDHDHHHHDMLEGGAQARRDRLADDLEQAIAFGALHHGVQAVIRAGETEAGFAELKLHDDKGDLELWLTKDEAGTQPMDFPLDTVIRVSMPELEQGGVELRVRNDVENEDEDGKPNIRNGRTHYFIFPGDTGVDASFLTGKAFVTPVQLSVTAHGKDYQTPVFELRPHVH